jgi:hypothetical protein
MQSRRRFGPCLNSVLRSFTLCLIRGCPLRTSLVSSLALLNVPMFVAIAQNAAESAPMAGLAAHYPTAWPSGPRKDSVPSWAKPGEIRFSRWDGGRIETAKAFLSGWPGLNPPDPNLLYTMTNWYDSKTISLLKEAHINLIWVTLSVGFSNRTEEAHQAEVRRYIQECHRQGIHVMAYESIANVFWEDLYDVLAFGKFIWPTSAV